MDKDIKSIKEACLRSLKDFENGASASDVYQNIVDKGYYEFSKNAKTPDHTVHAALGGFIRKGDNRVHREKDSKKKFIYYLTEYAENIHTQSEENPEAPDITTYMERDLHPLLATYLKGENILARTIYHEQSKKGSEEHAKWVHPDLVGARFVEYKNSTSQSFFKATKERDSVEIYSYELKKEIKNDYELKKNFFQAMSNSSWANYGFLVAFYIDDSLLAELERLSNSFGIGFIQLKANPYTSKVVFPAKRHELDFRTIDKLCELNPAFQKMIGQIENIITADNKHLSDSKLAFENACDKPFTTDTEIVEHCKKAHIPLDEDDEEE